MFLTDSFGWWDGIKRPFSYLFSDARSRFYKTIVTPEDELGIQKKETASLKAKLIGLIEENQRLKQLLAIDVRPEAPFLLAKIVGIGETELLVFSPEPEKIKINASVVSGKVLLGKVAKIDGSTIKVNLLNSRQTKIPVRVWQDQIDEDKSFLAEGILVGQEDKILLKEVLASEKISNGHIVGTVAENGEILLVAEIKKVFPSEDKIFQEAELKLLLDPRKIITVSIIE